MILSDKHIRERLENGTLRIHPILEMDKQLQPSSVDLRLADKFVIFRHSELTAIDPFSTESEEYSETIAIWEGGAFVLHPGEFALAATMEEVGIPIDLVGRVDGRSSIGRLGVLIHATAGFIDPGFIGTLTLELSNVGKLPVKLYPGMRICQISFEQLSSPAERPYGAPRGSKYDFQEEPTPSRMTWETGDWEKS